MANREANPLYHFNNVNGNEALTVRLAGGDSRRLQGLLEYYVERWNEPDHPFDGWRFLDRYPEVQEALREICRKPSHHRLAVRILRRLALAVRLQRRTFLHARLDDWRAACAQTAPIEALRAFGRIAGFAAPLPSAVERTLAREQQLRRERDTLVRMDAEGRASPLAIRRLDKLEALLLDPAAIARWVEKDTRRLVARLLPWAKVNTLGIITREAVRTHWEGMVDCPDGIQGHDWDNALHFYYSADQNKVILRRLLKHTAERDDGWRLRHAPNAKFLADLRSHGLDAEAWLTPYQRTAEVQGETWTVKLEHDPLRVLQMGNLFGTCLSVDDFNAFAAIANAVELNKQVLYLEDADGRIIGRKLIGLTPSGRLFGFRSYGAACLHEIDKPEKREAWIKILFDLSCLDLVRRVKGEFVESRDPDHHPDQLQLAADWYNDGPEGFDWWIVKPNVAESVHRGEHEPVAAAVLQHLELCGLDVRDSWDTVMETLRALLWLGDSAAAIIERLRSQFFAWNYLRYLRHQTRSESVRALLDAWHSESSKTKYPTRDIR